MSRRYPTGRSSTVHGRRGRRIVGDPMTTVTVRAPSDTVVGAVVVGRAVYVVYSPTTTARPDRMPVPHFSYHQGWYTPYSCLPDRDRGQSSERVMLCGPN